jgi:hypothetical protein
MSDDSLDDPPPFYSPNAKRPQPRQPRPGELLFEFTSLGGYRYRVELRDHGEFGVEAQFFSDGHLHVGHRWPTFELAIAWAEQERSSLEERPRHWLNLAARGPIKFSDRNLDRKNEAAGV